MISARLTNRFITASRRCGAALAMMMLGACATTATIERSPKDPFEPVNRAIWNFNDVADRALIKPLAEAYVAVLPQPARTCIANVFGNLSDVWSAVNSLLQGKPGECAQTVMRVGLNTVFGVGGCIDIASDVPGLGKKSEDFGQTLGKWGVGPGPYLVLPFFGPSTVRDGAGFIVDRIGEPLAYVDNVRVRNSAQGLRIVSLRASLLSAGKVLDGAALDRYSFVRDAFLQRRLNQVYDGDPPIEPGLKDDYLDDPETPAAAPAEKTQ